MPAPSPTIAGDTSRLRAEWTVRSGEIGEPIGLGAYQSIKFDVAGEFGGARVLAEGAGDDDKFAAVSYQLSAAEGCSLPRGMAAVRPRVIGGGPTTALRVAVTLTR